MNQDNLILATDSYKLGHWNQYPHDTEGVYSYFESRTGALYPETVFFGLQHIISQYLRAPISADDIEEAAYLSKIHFGNEKMFNRIGWEYILHEHGGYLPLRIKAVPEGSVIPTGNVMMTVENTDRNCYWLTNAVESLLTHVWYPSTVATVSYHVKLALANMLDKTSDSQDGLPFMLHDFGYRGASSHESAAIGGAAHLVNFKGTDTLPAMLLAIDSYNADIDTLAFSVPATEHSVMTSLGKDGEMDIVRQVIDETPTGILSVVADSYDIHNFVNTVTVGDFAKKIEARDGVFVIRPDSITQVEDTPDKLCVWIAKTVDFNMGAEVNSKGFRVLNPKVRILWGDGINPDGINMILAALHRAGYSAENMVFGMGGGLLQKVNRDTQRFAFKASAQRRDGEWHDIHKGTFGKESKRGRLKLIRNPDGAYVTIPESELEIQGTDVLETVFENGELVREHTFEDIRERAAQVVHV